MTTNHSNTRPQHRPSVSPRLILLPMLLVATLSVVGCGSEPQIDSTPLSEEQKEYIEEIDSAIDDEEGMEGN